MRCHRTHTTMAVGVCLKRQERAGKPFWIYQAGGSIRGVFAGECLNCETGRQAKADLLNDDDVEALKRDQEIKENIQAPVVLPSIPHRINLLTKEYVKMRRECGNLQYQVGRLMGIIESEKREAAAG